jgi:carboxymethylenebutenolidase
MCHADDVSFPSDRGGLTERVVIPMSDGALLPVVLQRPVGGHGAPIVLITDIYGPIEFYVGLAGDLADAGHPTLIPDYLDRAGPLESEDRETALGRARTLSQRRAVDDLRESVAWLGAQFPGAPRTGLLGFCLGGTLAWHAAAGDAESFAVVSFYGFPAGVPGRDQPPAPLDVVRELVGPQLALWGEEDYMDMGGVRRFCAEMAAHHDHFESHLYSGVGHGFLRGVAVGEPSAVDGWRRARAFFAAQLGDRAPARV